MICSKCNTEIPNGAKFCTVCGNPASAEFSAPVSQPEQAAGGAACSVCGKFVAANMRFCTSCGAPVGAAPEVPVIAATEVANGASFDDFKLPEPTAGFSAPAGMNVPLDAPAPAFTNAVPPQSFSQPTAGGYAQPQYVPQTPAAAAVMQPGAAVPQGGAATAVKKKKNIKKPIIISIIGIVVAALVAAAVLFFTNRLWLFSLFIGNDGVAAKVEGDSIKKMTDKLDAKQLSSRVKTTSKIFSAVAPGLMQSGALDKLPSLGGMGMFDTRPVSYSFMSGNVVDLGAIFAAVSDEVLSSFGVNSVSFTLGMSAELTDAAISESIAASGLTGEAAEEFRQSVKLGMDAINKMSVSFGGTISSDAVSAKGGAEVDGLKLDAKILVTKDGEIYAVLPFVDNNKGFVLKVDETLGGNFSFGSMTNVAALEIDESEIERIIDDIVDIYVSAVKSGKATLSDGTFTVATEARSGKLVTSVLDGKSLVKLVKDLADYIANDEYVLKKVLDYASQFGFGLDSSMVKTLLSSVVSNIPDNAFDGVEFSVTCLTDNNGEVYGKKYAFGQAGATPVFEYLYIDDSTSGAIEVKVNSQTLLTCVDKRESDSSAGEITVRVNAGSYGAAVPTIKISYKDASEEEFCGTKVPVGEYALSMELPSDFTQGASANIAAIQDVKYVMKSELSGSTYKSSIGVQSNTYGKVTYDIAMTAEKSTADLSKPTDVIDLSEMISGNMSDRDAEAFADYLQSIKSAVETQQTGEIGTALKNVLGQLIGGAGETDPIRIQNLLDDIYSYMEEIADFRSVYINDMDNDQKDTLDNIYSELQQIYSDIYNTYYSTGKLTSAQYESYLVNSLNTHTRFIEFQAEFLTPKYTLVEMVQLVSNAMKVLDSIANSSSDMAIVNGDDYLKSLYDYCQNNKTELSSRLSTAYRTELTGGEVSDSTMSRLRMDVSEFVGSVESLYYAV